MSSISAATRIKDTRITALLRALWLLSAIIGFGMVVISIPAYLRDCMCTPEVIAEWEQAGIAHIARNVPVAVSLISFAVFALIGAALFYWRSDDWLAVLAAFSFITLGTGLVALPSALPALLFEKLVYAFFDIGVALLVWLLFLYPTGRFVFSWVKWVVAANLLYFGLLIFIDPLTGLVSFVYLASAALALYFLALRYRHTAPSPQRQQIKWMALAIGALVVALLLLVIAGFFSGSFGTIFIFITDLLVRLALLLIPLSIGFAILRYRLWDVDLTINRSLVYAFITLELLGAGMLIFSLINGALQSLLGADNEGFAGAIAAGVVVALFTPARRQARNFVDRRIYGLRFNLDQLKQLPPITNAGILSGRTLDKYDILDVMGKGGMGEVYKGVSGTEEVAIKVLPADLATQPEFRGRFEREAEAMRQLDHPNIVRLHGYGTANGTPFIAMEFIEGQDLASLLQEVKMLSLEQAQRLMLDIAAALDYAHGLGYVHRDIKPSNMMIRREDGRAVLMDFGMVKMGNVGARFTGSGAVGTIDYMAPEQIMLAREVDHRADIYALGVVIYEMLTGKRLYDGTPAQVLFAHLQQPPPDPRSVNAAIQPATAYAILKALAKDPDDRWQSALEFIHALNTATVAAIA